MKSRSITPQALGTLLEEIQAEIRAEADWGEVASYIPELARIDPAQFGMSVCTAEGEVLSIGDATTKFSIQSISKVFTLALALGRFGDLLWRRVGKEPSGKPNHSRLMKNARRP